MTIVFFDTETTGLPRDYNAPSSKLDNWPRLVQLAWIVSDYEGNVINSENHIIIPNGFEIPSRSAAIHGITTSIAKSKGEKLIDVIDKFLGELQNATAIAGHNKIIAGTEYIENYAFKSCIDLEDLRLPNTIRVIGDNVFYGCDKLKKVYIPDGLAKIGILQERTKSMFRYKDEDYTIPQLVNLICKDSKED